MQRQKNYKPAKIQQKTEIGLCKFTKWMSFLAQIRL